MLVKSPVLAFYNPQEELTLENDASEYGIGSALIQNGKPIAYASCSLSQAERNYAQIEKEMLAITFGLEKFHHYTYGRPVLVVTDHKPLVSILNKPLTKAPRRLQSMILKTQEYDFQIIYKSGKDIPLADALSRAPLSEKCEEVFSVNNLCDTSLKPHRLNEIRQATQEDQILQLLKETIMKGWPTHKAQLPVSLTQYFNYRDELTVQDGIILRGERIVIPSSLRHEMKIKVHAGHSGMNSCLRRARELVYWPGMSSEIRSFVESCDVCSSLPYSKTTSRTIVHA